MPTTPIDPYRGFLFRLDIDFVTEAGFQECGGLDTSRASIDYREGTDPMFVRKLQGLKSVTPISLKRGLTDSSQLWDWYQKGDLRNGSIVLLDDTGAAKLRWHFSRAWPSKWTGPAFNSTGNSVAIESLEITHEELVRL